MADYRTTPSVGQLHENSCWAASLAWFLKQDPAGRPSWTQKQIIEEYWRSCDSNGAMKDEHLLKAWKNDQRLRMSTMVQPTPDLELKSLPLGSKPVCIAFRHMGGFAHMNVIWAVEAGQVMCMEPYWPYPGANGSRTGRFVQRSLEHFNFGDGVILAWANPPGVLETPNPAAAG